MTGSKKEIAVDLDARAGRIRPLHGVNNGPICFGGLVDLSSHHRSLEIPMVRLHDGEWPHPAVVDIPTIFPDFRADPDDPTRYHFEKTDDYVQSIVDAGAEIAALEAVTGKPCEENCGKPSPVMVETIMRAVGLAPEQCITTGDRLYTEIRMGIFSGMDTAVVFTGETTPEMLRETAVADQPTYSLDRIDSLLPERFW